MAAREFQFVFVDGPLDWTDWSMSIMARSDQLFLLTDLSLAGLHNGRRRLDLLQQQGLNEIPLELVITRAPKRRFRALSFSDAEKALGREVGHSIAEDDVSVTDSLTQGRLVADLHPHSRASRDLQALSAAVIDAAKGAA
jgi:pilus assembly protein CpaE